MAIAFSYTVATNTAVVTGGVAPPGTPATHPDFVAADRGDTALIAGGVAGASLKAAAVAAAGMTLTYRVRPVEYKSLYLTFTTAAAGGAAASGDESIDIYGTTGRWTTFSATEAAGQTGLSVTDASMFKVGDVVRLIDLTSLTNTETRTISAISLTKGANTITVSVGITAAGGSYVLGDIVGLNQTETIDTSAGHGAFVTTKAFGQVAYWDCNGYDGTNTVAVTQPIWGVIWDFGNGQYRIDCDLDVGDTTTSTYFTSSGEDVVFPAHTPYVRTNATLSIGVPSNVLYSGKGSTWTFVGQAFTRMFGFHGTILIHGSTIRFKTNYVVCNDCAITVFDSIFVGLTNGYGWLNYSCVNNYRNVYNFNMWLDLRGTFTLAEKVWVESCTYGWNASNTVTLRDYKVTNYSESPSHSVNCNLTILNPQVPIVNPYVYGTGWTKAAYTCDIHVTDKDGTNLASVTVLCEDKDGNDIFSVPTAADGTIAQQQIPYQGWIVAGTPPATTTYSPHKFTISKAGYQTLVVENITVSSAIKWHKELQRKAYLNAGGLIG